jgi:hypothetical protein
MDVSNAIITTSTFIITIITRIHLVVSPNPSVDLPMYLFDLIYSIYNIMVMLFASMCE